MKILTFLLALFLALPAFGHDIVIREDDPGLMTEVAEISVSSMLDFNDPLLRANSWRSNLDGHTWGPGLKGQTVECLTDPLGGKNARLVGGPTLPIAISSFNVGNHAYHDYTYSNTHLASIFGSGSVQSQSYGEWSTQGCGGNWRDPWSIVFAEASSAVSMRIAGLSCSLTGRKVGRVHLKFWGEDAALLGHRDITDFGPECAPIVSFTSTVPIKAMSTYVESVNGEGRGKIWGWIKFGVPIDEPPPPPPPVDQCLVAKQDFKDEQISLGCPDPFGG